MFAASVSYNTAHNSHSISSYRCSIVCSEEQPTPMCSNGPVIDGRARRRGVYATAREAVEAVLDAVGREVGCAIYCDTGRHMIQIGSPEAARGHTVLVTQRGNSRRFADDETFDGIEAMLVADDMACNG